MVASIALSCSAYHQPWPEMHTNESCEEHTEATTFCEAGKVKAAQGCTYERCDNAADKQWQLREEPPAPPITPERLDAIEDAAFSARQCA